MAAIRRDFPGVVGTLAGAPELWPIVDKTLHGSQDWPSAVHLLLSTLLPPKPILARVPLFS